MPKPSALYDEDDFDDDDYDDDYDDYDELPPQPKAPPKASTSKLAQSLTASKPPGVKKPSFAPPKPASSEAFDFSTASPDDVAIAARKANLPGTKPRQAADMIPLSREEKAAAAAAAAAAAQASNEAASNEAASNGPPAAGPPAPARPAYRDTAQYAMDAKLRKALQAAPDAGRQKLHIVVLGHVDAGKSTLMGRLIHDLGFVDAHAQAKNMREAEKAGKGSFGWAWVLDERPEERARGVTIDVSMQRFMTRKFVVTLLDAPGHRDFVPNMITGAAQADAALLVVDGSQGGFEKGFGAATSAFGGGQTREHVQVARSLGIQQLAVVISKLDTCEFSEARFQEVRQQLLPFLATCGFKERNLQWLAAAAPLGQNVTQPPTDPRLASWWPAQMTVADAIDRFNPVDRPVERPFRLLVSDVFKQRSLGGPAVGGKLECGAIMAASRALVLPANQLLTIKTIEVDGRPCDVAQAGDSVDVGVSGLEAEHFAAGSVLCHPDFPARIVVLDAPRPIIPGQTVMVHMHSAQTSGRISQLLEVLDARTGQTIKRSPRMLLKNQTALVQLALDRDLCMELPQVCGALSRIVIRMGGITLALGKVDAVL